MTHLARAEHDTLEVRVLGRVGGAVRCRCVHDHALEADALDALVVRDVIKFPKRALGSRMPQQILGGEDQQRLAELAVDLASEQMEVVGRGGAVCNLQAQPRHVTELIGDACEDHCKSCVH